MSLELRRTTSKSNKFAGRPVVYVVSNATDPKEASNETFQTKDILKKKYGAYWNKFEKRWEWTVFSEKDTEIALKKALTAVDEANEFLQNKADKIAPLIKTLNDIEVGIAQASSFVKKADAEDIVGKLRAFIKDLQNEVDETKFDEKIQNYLAFAASRRTFSLRNTLLLFIQRPDSRDARSKTNWGIVGRKPKPNAQSIILFRPPLRPLRPDEKKKIEADFRKRAGYGPTSQMSKADYTALQSKLKNGVPRSMNPDNFIPYAVFDVADTEPVKPGEGEVPDAIEWFNTEPNERADQLKEALTAASIKAGVPVKISSPEEDPHLQSGAKGYSSSGNIVLSSEATGIGGFRVMVHEFAHEILHQTHLKNLAKERKSDRDQDFIDLYVGKDDTQIKELQADATAYVVLKSYEIQDPTIANYLVLFRTDRKHIQDHWEVITKTANKIIQLTDAELGDVLNESNMRRQLDVTQVAKMLGFNMGKEEVQESTDFDRYEEVVFMQGEEAEKPLDILSQHGEEAAMKYLMQWHEPGNHMGRDDLGHGSQDYTFEKDGYIMSYNTALGYIGLIYDLQHDDLKHHMHDMGAIPLNEMVRKEIRKMLMESMGLSDVCGDCGGDVKRYPPDGITVCSDCGSTEGPIDNVADTMREGKGPKVIKLADGSYEVLWPMDGEIEYFNSYEELPKSLQSQVKKTNEVTKKKGYNYEVYHDTLAGAFETIQEFLAEKGYEVPDEELFQFGIGGISYGQTKRDGFELTRNGEPAKNMLNVQIYRMDSGRYELNMYYNNSRSMKEYAERNSEDYPWYCSNCDEELQWFDVTYEETCAKCGEEVVPNEEGQDYSDMSPEDYSGMMMEKHDVGIGHCEKCGGVVHGHAPDGVTVCTDCGATEGPVVKNEAAYDDATKNELAWYISKLSTELASAKSESKIKYLEKDIEEVKAALAKKRKDDKKVDESLWDNIRKKRARGEKPAKPGDKDYPDSKAWKKAQNEELTQEEWEEANSLLEKADGWEECKPSLEEAEYQGRKVKLNKPMRGDVKKFKVYVKNDKGNVVKVNFGQKGVKIKKNNPERRKSFRARHNCDNPGPKTSAKYWSCKKW